jgi:GH35 family endo-1,4-beta-xylanase
VAGTEVHFGSGVEGVGSLGGLFAWQRLRLLFAVGVNRRAFLKAGSSAAALLLSHPAWCVAKEGPKPTDGEILVQCGERIERHRKGDGAIIVRDARGKPVKGVKVRVEQLRHDFLFGSNFFMFGHCGNPELEAQYRQRFSGLLNYCTLGFYWASYEHERGKPNYEYTDQVVAWTREHGITAKGHPLVWDHPAGSPSWLPDDPKEIERLSTGRVRDIVSRYQGRIDIWDVVNEATHLANKPNKTKMADWAASLGAVPYVKEHLKVARAANPSATLLVNDYRIEPAYYHILDGLRENGKPLFNCVGIQSHMHNGVWPFHKVWDTCDTYSKLGLPLHFTESTILSGERKGPGENWGPTTTEGEARQAFVTPKFYTVLFAHPAVQAITWWDFSDLGAWQGAPAGWLRRDMSPKPVYDELMSLIKSEWWSDAEATTDSRGKVKVCAFYGTHRITVRAPGGEPMTKEVHWERGGKNRFEVSA